MNTQPPVSQQAPDSSAKQNKMNDGHAESKKLKEDVARLTEELTRAREEAEAHLDGWKRAKADYANLQKEHAEKWQEMMTYANSNFILELLPLVDYFKYGFRGVPEDQKDSPWMQGIQHIYNQFMEILKRNGVEEVKTVGEKIDPNLHEAVEELKNDKPQGTILEEVKSGFRLNGKVIQHAKVKIAK